MDSNRKREGECEGEREGERERERGSKGGGISKGETERKRRFLKHSNVDRSFIVNVQRRP